MILGGVDIPDRVLAAHEERRLVFFTGAGVSIAPPSGLPSFAELAKRIADRAYATELPTSRKWKTRLDAYLGHLAHEGAPVHDLAREAVTPASSKPNSLHISLTKIAARTQLRIVTTNYDLHFESTCADLGIETEAYSAPALPLGDKFDGIVHLHGSVQGPAQRMVVTDKDFGMAYLRDAWAARFLERMFQEHTVVFVGYSHEDVVMKYLGLALGPASERFAFTPKTADPGWDRLGITPILYSRAKNHRALTDCLEAWAKLAAMGLLDHQQRIRSLVSGPIKLKPDERAYLIDTTHRPARAKFFFHEAKDLAWLDWAVAERLLDGLFASERTPDDLLTMAAGWFVGFILDEKTAPRAWEVLVSSGGRLSVSLWNALAFEIFRIGNSRPEHLRPWIHLLARDEQDGCNRDYLGYILETSVWPTDRVEILELLRHLTEPEPRARSTNGLAWSPWEITARGDEFHLTAAIEKLIQPNLDDVAARVLQIAEDSLIRHLWLHRALNGTGFDPFTFHRSAIQAHPQDAHRDPIDAVIDLARDALEHLAGRATDGEAIIQRWLASDVDLLKRLAVHGLKFCEGLSADDKMVALAERGLFGDSSCQQEVYELIAICAPRVSGPELERSVKAVLEAEDGTLAKDYRIYSLLEWLLRHGAAPDHLEPQLTRLVEAHPDFQPTEQPGFTHWMEVGWVEPSPPTTAEDLHGRIGADPAATLAFLLEFKGSEGFLRGQPGWGDAVSLLGQTVRTFPADGVAMWPLTVSEPDLRGSMIPAWALAADRDLLKTIVELLLSSDLAPMVDSVAQLFAAIPDGNECPWDDVPGIEELIDRAWDACMHASSGVAGSGWFTSAINHPVAHLMEFWFDRFRRAWAAAGDDWDEMRPADANFLSKAIHDPGERGRVALALTAGRAHWFHVVDPTWFNDTLLPCADWSDADRAAAFWHGFLYHGRVSDGSLEAGLLAGLVATGQQLDTFARDQQWRWAQLLATAALEVGLAGQHEWLQHMTASSPLEARVAVLKAIGERMGELPPEARDAAWNGWGIQYWTDRFSGIPNALTLEEASTFARWLPFVPSPEVGSAVDLLITRPARLGRHDSLLRDISDEFIESHPHDLGRLLAHLMTYTPAADFFGHHDLIPVLEKVVAKPGQWRDLQEAALGLGIALV